MKTIIHLLKITLGALLVGMVSTPVVAQDITAMGGVLTVFEENPGGNGGNEGSLKVVDGNTQTKFFSQFPDLQWLQFQLDEPAAVGIYTLTTANDAPERDPKDWILEGSHNGVDWEVLDTQVNYDLGSRFNTLAFEINNSEAFEYYRLYITDVKGDAPFQLSEWRLFAAGVPEVPANFQASSAVGDEVYLEWEHDDFIEQGFEIERSLDNINFEKVVDLSSNQISYYDRGLHQGTTYFYRIRSYNGYGESAYSPVVEVTTLNQSGAPRDLTDNGGALTVSNENNNQNENSPKLIDNATNSKYLIPVPTYWVIYESTTAEDIVTKYTLISANDAPDRDPKNWTFEGSNDGTEWVVLDERINQKFTNRFQERTFAFENNETYKFYKLNVTANNGGGISQIAEWQIWGIPVDAPETPENLTVTEVTENAVSLAWDDVASNETGYEIWRSTDGTSYSLVVTTTQNASSAIDEEVKVLTTYYYKIRAIGSSGNSIYSNIVEATTPYDENLPLPANDFAVTALSETSAELTWTDRAYNEAGYEIERSRDGEDFTIITTVDTDAVSFIDEDLRMATRYFYRIRPFNDYSEASEQEVPYTDVVEVITLGVNEAPTMDELTGQSSCNFVDTYTIPVEGLTPGPETDQLLSLAVTTDNNELFKELSVSEVVDGKGSVFYKLNEGVTGDAILTVTVQDDGGTLNDGTDSFSRTLTVTAYELEVEVTADFSTEKVTRGSIIELTATGAGDYEYQWQEGPGILTPLDQQTITVKPNQNYIYTVNASTDEGCMQSVEFLVQIEGSPYLVEPQNILTPNNDQKNDTWVIWNINTYPGNYVRVYDTEGRIVFEQEDYNNDWDGSYGGTRLSSGTYYYIIDLGSGIQPVKGTLTILQY